MSIDCGETAPLPEHNMISAPSGRPLLPWRGMRLSPRGEHDETYAVAQSDLTSFDCWDYPSLFKGYTERMSQSDLVVVQSCATEGAAEIAKGVLQSSGIDAMIQADTAGRMREHLAWSGLGHRVLVREEDAAAARSLLAVPQNDDLELRQNAREIQVEILQGALLSADIFATVRYDGTYYQLLVNKEDIAAARKVLETLPKV